MVQLDAVVTDVLPDSIADAARGWHNRVLEFNSIRVPHLEGFHVLEGRWCWRDRNRTRSIARCGVNHMPQTHDASMLVRFVAFLMVQRFVPLRAQEGNCGSGCRFECKAATSSFGAGSGEQK